MTKETPTDVLVNRRAVVKSALIGLAAIPVITLCGSNYARAADLPVLDEKDPQAKALGYVTDASRVDAKSNPTFKSGQACANCLQLTGNTGDSLRPCNLFPGKRVNANGWCKAWVKKN